MARIGYSSRALRWFTIPTLLVSPLPGWQRAYILPKPVTSDLSSQKFQAY